MKDSRKFIGVKDLELYTRGYKVFLKGKLKWICLLMLLI